MAPSFVSARCAPFESQARSLTCILTSCVHARAGDSEWSAVIELNSKFEHKVARNSALIYPDAATLLRHSTIFQNAAPSVHPLEQHALRGHDSRCFTYLPEALIHSSHA